jgi:hypothetical protein
VVPTLSLADPVSLQFRRMISAFLFDVSVPTMWMTESAYGNVTSLLSNYTSLNITILPPTDPVSTPSRITDQCIRIRLTYFCLSFPIRLGKSIHLGHPYEIAAHHTGNSLDIISCRGVSTNSFLLDSEIGQETVHQRDLPSPGASIRNNRLLVVDHDAGGFWWRKWTTFLGVVRPWCRDHRGSDCLDPLDIAHHLVVVFSPRCYEHFDSPSLGGAYWSSINLCIVGHRRPAFSVGSSCLCFRGLRLGDSGLGDYYFDAVLYLRRHSLRSSTAKGEKVRTEFSSFLKTQLV